MPEKPAYFYRQSAALPIKVDADSVEVLLVTTRRGRWIAPKGIVEPGWDPLDSAAREAWEEAGVRGRLARDPLGRYQYPKWGGVCSVEVFVLVVEEEEDQYPDRVFRTREWLSLEECVHRVDVPGLADCLRGLARWLESDLKRDWVRPDRATWAEERGT